MVFIRMENFRLRTVLLRWKRLLDKKKAVAAAGKSVLPAASHEHAWFQKEVYVSSFP